MKRSEIFFAISQVILDFFALLLAAFVAYSIRFSGFFVSFRPAVSLVPWSTYITLSLFMALVWVCIFFLSGLYPIGRPKKILGELGRIISACSTGFVAVTILLFLARDVLSSRFIVLAAWALAIILVVVSHLLLRGARKLAFSYGVGVHRVVLVGDQSTQSLAPGIFSKFSGYHLVRFLDAVDDERLEEVARLKAEDKIDDLFFIHPHARHDELLRIKNFSESHHINFSYAADPFLISHRNIEFGTLAGIPIVELKKSRLDGWGKVFKRSVDFIAALLLIIIFAPMLAIIALFIRFTSRGPVIFRNERIGEDGKVFDTLKFRTMYERYSIGKQFANQEEARSFEEDLIRKHGIKDGPVYKIANDPRVTSFGRLLRRTSCDELPQLWNVMRGDMSLVGPRPHQPREVEKYTEVARKVLNIKPGITGMAQISGRSNLSFEEEVRLDTYYIENWSPWLDLYILLKTPFVILSNKGAY